MNALVTNIEQLPNDELGNEVWKIETIKGTFQFTISPQELEEAFKRRGWMLGTDTDEQCRMKILVNKTLGQLLMRNA